MTSPSSDSFRAESLAQPNATSSAFPFRSEATLVDAVDHLLNRGAVLVGEATISLAGIELIYVGLNLLVSSVETLRTVSPEAASPPNPLSIGDGEGGDGEEGCPHPDLLSLGEGQGEGVPSGSPPSSGVRGALGAGPGEGPGVRSSGAEGGERPEQGLARLVLTLVELLRQTLERQAVRRMEGGALSEEDIERMGIALLELEQKMAELREIFDLEEADLNLDLGPLGRLL